MNATKNFRNIFNWSFFVIVLVGIIAVNIISSYLYTRVDMTSDQRFSLAQGTKDFLSNDKNFTNRMTIRIYLEGTMPAELKLYRDAIEDKLKEFKQFAGSNIEYQFIDPNKGTDEEQKELKDLLFANGKGILPMDVDYRKDGGKSEITLWPGAIINYGGKDVNVIQFLPGTIKGSPNHLEGISQGLANSIANLEYVLLSSIKRAVQTEKKRIAFIQGHGELTFAQTQRARALLSPYYMIEDVTIDGKLKALEGFSGAIIARPTQQFDPRDLFILDQFLMEGGRLMCFMDALQVDEDTLYKRTSVSTVRIKTGLEDLLFDYGLKLNENLVMDVQCAPKAVPFAGMPYVPWFFHVLSTNTSHPIARNLGPVSLKYVSEVQFVNSVNAALTPILTTSTNATVTGLAPLVSLGIPLNYGDNPKLVDNPKLESNKRCLAGLSEGMYSSYFKTRIVDEYAKNPDAKILTESVKEGKVLLVGNGRFIQNRYDSTTHVVTGQTMYRPVDFPDLRMDEELYKLGFPVVFGNQEFLQNLVDYVMGDNSVLDIRSRQIDVRRMDNTKVKASANMYKVINLLVPSTILIVMVLGFVLVRRRKYAVK